MATVLPVTTFPSVLATDGTGKSRDKDTCSCQVNPQAGCQQKGSLTSSSRSDLPLQSSGLSTDPNNLQKKTLIFLCTEAWPPYPLGDQEKWP
jgi:hypothetical protein